MTYPAIPTAARTPMIIPMIAPTDSVCLVSDDGADDTTATDDTVAVTD